MKTPFLDAVHEMKLETDDKTENVKAALRERGWNHTSSTPGCYWLWIKKLPEQYDSALVMVDFDAAVRIELELCGEHYQDFE